MNLLSTTTPKSEKSRDRMGVEEIERGSFLYKDAIVKLWNFEQEYLQCDHEEEGVSDCKSLCLKYDINSVRVLLSIWYVFSIIMIEDYKNEL